MQVVAFSPREPRSLSELRDVVSDVSARMDALCELLSKASGTQIQTEYVHVLLQPLRAQLDLACCELNDLAH